MALSSIGTRAIAFQNQQNNVNIRTDLYARTDELSTGRKADVAAHLNGDVGLVGHIDRRIELLQTHTLVANETGSKLTAMQASLDVFDDARQALSEENLLINEGSSEAQIARTAVSARATLEQMIAALNTQYAGKSLFAGASTQTSAIASAHVMLADLQAALVGALTTADVEATLDTWFDDPAGGFATQGYLGDSGDNPQIRLGDGTTISFDARADDPEVKKVLRQVMITALVDDDTIALNRSTQLSVLQSAGTELLAASQDVTNVRAGLGVSQSQTDQALANFAAEDTSLKIAYNSYTSADPFEVATELEQLQTQLDAHYTLTARLARLNLTEYLR